MERNQIIVCGQRHWDSDWNENNSFLPSTSWCNALLIKHIKTKEQIMQRCSETLSQNSLPSFNIYIKYFVTAIEKHLTKGNLGSSKMMKRLQVF